MNDDISPDFVPNDRDSEIIEWLLQIEKTPRAIQEFSKTCHLLTDYSYWFVLGTLWVSYSGWSDLKLWKRLFKGIRPNRETSLMKPSELAVYRQLPDVITAYRAHRTDETDWISYTLSPEIAGRFARERGVNTVTEYQLRKRNVIALFLRREEQELIMLRPDRAQKIRPVPVITIDNGMELHPRVMEG